MEEAIKNSTSLYFHIANQSTNHWIIILKQAPYAWFLAVCFIVPIHISNEKCCHYKIEIQHIFASVSKAAAAGGNSSLQSCATVKESNRPNATGKNSKDDTIIATLPLWRPQWVIRQLCLTHKMAPEY